MATYCIPRSDVVALQDYVTRMNKEYPRRQKETKARLAFFEAELPKLMAVDTKSELVGVSHAFLTEVFTTFFAFLKTETPKLLQLALDVFLSLAKSHSPILEQFDVSDLDCNVVRVNRNMVCTLLTKLYALSLLNYPLARPVAETIVRIVEVVALAYNDVHFDDIREPVRILFLSGLIEFNLYKDSSLALSKVILSFNKKLDTYGRDFDTLLSYASASAEGGGAAAATAATAETAAAALDPTVQEIMTLIRRPVFFPDDAVSNLFVHDMLYLLRYLTFLLSADAGCATPLTINRMLQIATADAVGPSTGLTSLFSTVEAAEILRSMALQCLVLLLSSANTHYLRVPEIRCYVTEVLFPLVYTRILPFYFADGEFVTFCYSLLELILRLYYRHTPAAFVRNYFEGFVLRVLNTPDLPSAEFKMSLLLHVGRLFSGDIPCKRPFDIEELESLLDYHGRCSIVLRGPDDAAVFQLLYCRPLEFFLNMYTTFDCSYHSSNLTERVIGCLVGYTTGLEKGQKYLSSVAGTVNVLRADAQAAVHPPFVLKQWRNSHLSYLHSGFVAALNRTSMTTLAKVVGGAPGAGADLRGGAHGGPCSGTGAGASAGGRLAGSLPATEYVQALLTMSAACGVDLANLRASLNYVDPTQLACTNVSQCALYSITRISNGFASWYNAMAYRRHLRLSAFGRQGAADVFGAAFSFDGENAGRMHSKNIMTILKAHNSKREHEMGFSLFETKPLKGIAYFEGKGALPALQRAPEAVPDAAADGSAEWRLRPASPLQRCPSPEPSTHMHAQAQAHTHHPSVDNDRSDEVSTTSTALTSSVADTLAAAISGAAGAGTGTGAASAQSAIGMSADGERGAHRRRKRNFEEDFAASLQAIHAYYRQFTNAAEHYERLNEFIFEHATEDPEMSLGLSKTAIGELIGGSAIECRAVLLAYVGHFTRKWDAEYAETRRRLMPDQALREFLGTFRLPGEGQVIDRILIFLSHGYVSSTASYLRSHKTCHGLMFAIVMLNTDLHNTSLEGKRMSKESFIRNTVRVDYSGELRGCREDGAPLHAAAADADAPFDVHASAHADAHADAQAAEVPAADAQPQADVSAPPSRDLEVPPPAADADAHSNGNGNGRGGGAGTGADDDSGNNLAPRTPTEPGVAAAAVRALTPASASPRLPPASAGNASWLLSTIYDAIRDNPFTLNSIEKLSKLRMILDRHFMVNEGAGNLSRGGKDGRDANGRDLLNEVGPGHAEYAVRVARCISEWVAEADSNFALVAPPARTPSQLLQPEPLAAGGPNGVPDAPGPVLAPPPPTRTNVVAVSVSSALLPPTREGTRLTCFKRAPTLYTGDPFTLVKEKYVPVFFESLLYKLDMRVFAAVQRFLIPIDRTLAATTFQICVEALLSLLYIFCNADGRQLAALRATSVQALVKMTVIPTVRNLGDDIENELSLFLTSSAAQAGAVTGVIKDVDVSVNILKVRLVEFLLNFALSVAESNRLAPRVIDHAAWYAQNFLSLLGAPAGAGAGAGTGAEGGGSVEGVSIGAIAAASAAASAGVGAPTASADAGAPGERATRLLPGGGGGGGGGAGTGGDPRERGRQPSSGSVRRVTASAIPRAPDAVVYHGKLVLAESWGDIIGLISRIQYFLLVMDKIHTGSLMAPVYALPAGSSRTFISMYASAGGAGPSPKAIIGDLARTAIPYSSTIYATNSLNSAVFSYATIQAGQALSYRDGRRHSPILTNSSEVLADAVQDYKQNLNCSDNFAKTVHYVSSVFTGRSVEQFFDSVLFLNETELIHIAVALAATSRDEIVSESELEYQTFSIVKLVDLLSYALDRSQGLFMKLWGQSGYHFAMLGSYSNHYLAQKGCDCLKLLTNAYLYKLHKRLAKLSMAPAVGGLTAAQRLGKAMSLVAAPVSASGAASGAGAGAGAGAARPPHVYEFVAGSDGLPRSSSLEEQPPRRSPSFDPDGGNASSFLGASTLGGTIGSALGSTLGGATDGSDDEYLADGPDETDADERADADPPSRTGSRHASQKSLSRSIAQANSFQAKLFQPFISIVSGTAFLEIIDFSLTCIEMFFVMFAVKPAAPTPTPVRAGALSLQMSLPLQQSLATDEETEPSAVTIGPGPGPGPAAGTAAAVAGGPSTNLSVFTPVGLGVIIKILTAAVSRTCADASFKNEAMKVSIVNRTRTLAKSLILLLRDVKSEYASIMFLLDSLREQALVTSIATETLWVMRSMLDTCWLDILGVVASFDHSDGGDERSLPGFLDSPQARNYIECFKILLEATFDPHPPVRAEAFVVVRKVLMMHFGVVFCDATLQHVWAVGPGADAGADAPAAGPAGAAVAMAPLSPGEAEGEAEGETEVSTAAPAKAAPAAASAAATGGSGGAEDPGPARRTVLRGQQHRSCELAMRTILREVERQGVDPCVLRMGKARMFQTLVEDAIAPKLKIMVKSRNKAAAAAAPAASAGVGAGGGAAGRLDPERVLADGCFDVFGRGASFNDMGFVCGGICDKHDIIDVMVDVLLAEDYAQSLAYVVHYLLVLVLRYSSGSVLGTLCYLVDMFAFASEALLPLPPAPAGDAAEGAGTGTGAPGASAAANRLVLAGNVFLANASAQHMLTIFSILSGAVAVRLLAAGAGLASQGSLQDAMAGVSACALNWSMSYTDFRLERSDVRTGAGMSDTDRFVQSSPDLQLMVPPEAAAGPQRHSYAQALFFVGYLLKRATFNYCGVPIADAIRGVQRSMLFEHGRAESPAEGGARQAFYELLTGLYASTVKCSARFGELVPDGLLLCTALVHARFLGGEDVSIGSIVIEAALSTVEHHGHALTAGDPAQLEYIRSEAGVRLCTRAMAALTYINRALVNVQACRVFEGLTRLIADDNQEIRAQVILSLQAIFTPSR